MAHYDIVITQHAIAWSRICPTTGGALIESAGDDLITATRRWQEAANAMPAGMVCRLMDQADYPHEFASTH